VPAEFAVTDEAGEVKQNAAYAELDESGRDRGSFHFVVLWLVFEFRKF